MSAQTLPAGMKSPTRPLSVECRVRQRHSCDLKSSCQPIAARADKDILWSATVRDISVSGLGLVVGRRFERGTGLAIEIPPAGKHAGDTLLVKVVHITALAGGTWLLGCAFVSELSEDGLMGLVELARLQQTALDQAAPEDQELAAEPAAGNAKSMLVSDIRLSGSNHRGRVASVPVNRLFLTGTWPLAAGTLLKVRVAQDPDRYPPVFLKVTSCALEEGRWTLRYTFAKKPPPEMMHLLGHLVSGEWKL
jgi:hypothetical protein